MSVTVVTQIQRVVVRGSGASYSDARVLAYLRTVLTTNGDLLTVAAGTLARVGIGSSGQVLTVSGGSAVWAAPTGFANPMSAQGDLIIGGVSGAPTRLARGTNGQILSVSGSTLAWIDPVPEYTDADAIDAIEALGNGVLVTAGGVLDNVVGTEGQVLTWTGGTAVFAAASGGYTDPLTTNGDLVARLGGVTTRLPIGTEGYALQVVSGLPAWAALPSSMTNPMTSTWDLIRGGASGTPTRLAVGPTHHKMRVSSAGELVYSHVGGIGLAPTRGSIAYSDGAGSVVFLGATVNRLLTSQTNGYELPNLGTYRMHAVTTSAGATQWAGWTRQLTPQNARYAYFSASGIFRLETSGAANGRACGLILGSPNVFVAAGAYFTETPGSGVAYSFFGLRCWLPNQTTWHFLVYDGTTLTDVDTGITLAANASLTATNGSTHRLVAGQDGTGCFWEVWNEAVSPPALLGSGRVDANTPTALTGAGFYYSSVGIGSSGAAAQCSVNCLSDQCIGPGGY